MLLMNKHGNTIDIEVGPNFDSMKNVLSLVESIYKLKQQEDLVESVVRDFIRNCSTLDDPDDFSKQVAKLMNQDFFVYRNHSGFLFSPTYNSAVMDGVECWCFNSKDRKFYVAEPLKNGVRNFRLRAGDFNATNYF